MSDDMTTMSLSELREFADALETFKANIEKRCNHMETGISGCTRFMQDDTSKTLLKKAQASVDEIRDCLNPTVHVLERVYRMIDVLEQGYSL